MSQISIILEEPNSIIRPYLSKYLSGLSGLETSVDQSCFKVTG